MVEGIQKRFFENRAHGSAPAYSLSDFDKGLFRTVGQILSASLAEGGPAPNFLTDWCYHYLCRGEIKDWTKDDVGDPTYTDLISRIEGAAEPELQELANDVFSCGYSGLISGGKKDEMIRAVILHANLRLLPILQQMKEGLSLFGLGNIMTRHPDICRPLFVPGDEVTVDADYINSILLAEHSEEGSIRRAREMAIMQYFQDFLQELEEGGNNLHPLVPKEPKNILQWSLEHQQEQEQEHEQDENELRPMCPKDILQWITGQGHIPLNAQEKSKFVVTVTFNHDCTTLYGEHGVCYPACTNSITFPVAHMRSIADFRSVVSKAYIQGQDFSCM